MNPLEWMTDPALFGRVFGGPTWEGARTLVAAIYGLPMTPSMLAIYQQCTQRTAPPSGPFREVWVTSGRRSGKSILTAFLAIYTALRRNWREVLAPGEEARIPVFAVDRAQAGILFRFCRGLLKQSPMCEEQITGETRQNISFSTGATIEIATRDWRLPRGKACPFITCEETPVWPADEQSANPAQEFLRAVLPTQIQFPDALLMSIGSAYARRGIHYERMVKFEGSDDPRVLTWRSTTEQMHPSETIRREIEQALADDPASARAEFFSEERADVESFLSSDRVLAVCVPDRVSLPPTSGHGCFVDSAAGGACAYTAAIWHVEWSPLGGSKVIIDHVAVLDPPLNTSHGGTKHVAELCRQYGVHTIYGDAFAGDWVAGEFRKYHLAYERSPLVKTDLFLEALPIILSGACELPHPDASAVGRRLFRELVSLDRRVSRGRTGREEITKPRGARDDVANSVCGALALAARPHEWTGKVRVRFG